LITGDFNGWHKNWGSNQNNTRGKILEKFITQSNYILLNDMSPTHFSTHNTLTNVDLTFSSPMLQIDSKWQTEDNLFGSDHFPIIITLFTSNTSNRQVTPRKPTFLTDKANWQEFCQLTEEYSAQRQPSTNINKEAATIHKIILSSAHKAIPQTHPISKTQNVPWWNNNLSKLRADKMKKWHDLRRNITTEHILKYKKANALFRLTLKQDKKQSINNFTSQISPETPPKTIWSNIRRFCGLNPQKNIHCIFNPTTNQNTTHKLEIADLFCKNFSEISSDTNFTTTFIHQKQTSLNNTHTLSYIPSKRAIEIEKPITPIEFAAALNTLKGNTPGLDRINYTMIKNIGKTTKNRIISLQNSILNNYIPQTYKNSLIIPIIKPNTDKTNLNSYRPISLNSCLSKILDKIIAKRLWWFVLNDKLIQNSQTGFRKGKSAMDSLLLVDHLLPRAISRRNHASIISLDFAKAFDRIGIHSILNQLAIWKTGPKITNYIKNYMTNRKILVRIKSDLSPFQPIQNGIPQGSPLSVILFVIAYNQLAEKFTLHPDISLSAYADDFNLILKLKNRKNININHSKLA